MRLEKRRWAQALVKRTRLGPVLPMNAAHLHNDDLYVEPKRAILQKAPDQYAQPYHHFATARTGKHNSCGIVSVQAQVSIHGWTPRSLARGAGHHPPMRVVTTPIG